MDQVPSYFFDLIGAVVVLFIVLRSVRICTEWQRKVVLRLGRFAGVRGPGLIFIVPWIERVAMSIDVRTYSTPLRAEQTLTRDGASVTVDMIVFWRVVNPELAALRVTDYSSAVLGSAQASLRDVIGRTDLGKLLSDRQSLDAYLAQALDTQTEPWGIKVESVQLKDIQVPDSLKDSMSRYAQAEREAAARGLLGESEKKVAQSFADAAAIYDGNHGALQLRGMNMLYEVMKGGSGTVILVPSSALDAMNVGGVVSLASGAVARAAQTVS